LPDSHQYVLRYFASLIEKEVGIRYKDDQYQLKKRLDDMSQIAGYADCSQFYDFIKNNGLTVQLREMIWNLAGNHETSFFRNKMVFTNTLRSILDTPDYQKMIRPVKIWSAACSSGQEAYSIAIVCAKWQSQQRGRQVNVIASDVSSDMLKKATSGSYSLQELNKDSGLLPEEIREWFDTSDAKTYHAKTALKSRVLFLRQNLLQPLRAAGAHGPFDIIFLRNVLIYFHEAIRKKVTEKVADLLVPNGYLIPGATESLSLDAGNTGLERMSVNGNFIYQKKPETSVL